MLVTPYLGQWYQRLPKVVRKIVFKSIKLLDKPGRYFRTQADVTIPRQPLSQRHVENCQLTLDRATMLSRLPKGGVAAELGVDQGNFSETLLRILQPATLHLVDLWGSDRYSDDEMNAVAERFSTEISEDRVRLLRQYSLEAAAEFPDDHFQFVYIDTDHSYFSTAKELAAWAPKIAQGGVLAGHDYVLGNWKKANRYGVIEAVHEFCVKENWELVFMTIDPIENQSFAIRKLG